MTNGSICHADGHDPDVCLGTLHSPDALSVWRRGMEALAACEDVSCKISGLPVLGEPYTLASNQPIILDTISMFGVDRCMFASNFPVDGLKGSWDYIYSTYKRAVANLDANDREKLFSKNALKFCRIDIASTR